MRACRCRLLRGDLLVVDGSHGQDLVHQCARIDDGAYGAYVSQSVDYGLVVASDGRIYALYDDV